MKKLFTLLFCFVFVAAMSGQISYTLQPTNFNATLTANTNSNYFAGVFSSTATELGNYANGSGTGYTGNPGVVSYQTFTATGASGGAARPLKVGDEFVLTSFVASNTAFYTGSNAGISFNGGTASASFGDYLSNQRAKFQVENGGAWLGSAASAASGSGAVNADRTFKIKLTSANTAILTVDGTVTYDLVLAGSPATSGDNIQSFAIWNQTSGNGNNMYWKNASLTATGTVELGNGNGTSTISGVISDGLTAAASPAAKVNAVTKAGSGTITLTAANTYTGTTTVTAGTLKLGKTGGTTIPASNDVTVTGGTLQISSNQTLANLTINGGSVIVDDGVVLSVTGTLTFTTGNITLGATGNGNVLAFATAGGGTASHVVINPTGTGGLSLVHTSTAAKTYQVGPTATLYDPVTITPTTAAPASFKARVSTTINSAYTLSSKQTGFVTPRQWDVTLLSGAPTVTLALTSSDLSKVPSGSVGVIGHWNGSSWDDVPSVTYAGGVWTATGVSAFSPFVVSQPAIPLSMDLQNISAQVKGSFSVVNWSTASEKSNASFQIERAANGRDFVSIGQVKGAGNSNALNSYTFTDVAPLSGVNYYRLKAVDFNGAVTLSKVVAVDFAGKGSNKTSVYPNPTRDVLRVEFAATDATTTAIQVTDLVGRVLLSQNVTVVKGANFVPLNVVSLPSGAYFVKVNNDVTRFVKL